MHRFFVSKEFIDKDKINISGDDVNHILKVLRLKNGEKIIVCDRVKTEYLCSILSIDKKSIICNIIESKSNISEPPIIVDLFQGIPKSTKMDLIVQKCTELGINSIIPVDTQRTIIKTGYDKDSSNKLVRYQRIAEEAAKQSSRGHIPDIFEPISFERALKKMVDYDMVVMPYENELHTGLKQTLKGKNNINKIAIIIGPEGGFTEQEVAMARDNGAATVTLGPRILRTETAGFMCLSIIMYELGDTGGKLWQE